MNKQLVGYLASIILIVILWQFANWVMQIAFDERLARTLPGPIAVFSFMFSQWDLLTTHTFATGSKIIIAVLISLAIAIPMGLYIGHNNVAKNLFSPLIYTAYPIPKVVFWPILFILIGLNAGSQDVAKITFIALVIAFQLIVSIRDAAENIPRDYITSAVAAGVSRMRIYWDVVLPGSLPAIFTGLRVSLGLGTFAVYVAETTFAIGEPPGLGLFIVKRYQIFQFEQVFAGIAAFAVLGLVLYLVLEVLERWLCRWKYIR